MSRSRLCSLVAGLAIAALGALLLLDAEEAIALGGGWLLALVAGLSGAALIASGLSAREP